jgi:hypothetical protein
MRYSEHHGIPFAVGIGIGLGLLLLVALRCPRDRVPPPQKADPDPVSNFQIPGQDFSITLPSEGWRLDDGWRFDPEGSPPKHVTYTHLWPPMVIMVLPVNAADTEQIHQENSKQFKDAYITHFQTTLLSETDGTNEYGHPFWMGTLETRSRQQQFNGLSNTWVNKTVVQFVALSTTWLNKKKTVAMIFVRDYTYDDPVIMERERPTFRNAAERALRSLH